MEEDSTTTAMNVNLTDAEDSEAKMKTFMMYKIGKSVRASVALSMWARILLVPLSGNHGRVSVAS